MPIRLTLPVKVTVIETKASLHYERMREDIAKLLTELKQGRTLLSVFSSAPVANAVSMKLIREGLLDGSGSLTAKSDDFIANPMMAQDEDGIFSFESCYLSDEGLDATFVPQIMRKLSAEKAEKSRIESLIPVQGVEFGLDASEKGYMISINIDGSQTAYLLQEQKSSVVFNLSQGTYEYKGKRLSMGDKFRTTLFRFAVEKSKELFPYCTLTEDMSVVVHNLEDFDTRSLMNGVTTLSAAPVELIDIPLLIKSETVANKYVFLWLYEHLMTGNYYSLEEMEELVQNEIATSPIIDAALRDYVSTIEVNRNAFKRHLPPEKYSKLDYRLRVMEEYLGLQTMKNMSFSRSKSYGELASAIANEVSPSEVTRLRLVMGYPFVKTKNNRILDSIDALKVYYPNMTIVFKKWRNRPNQEEDPNLRTMVSRKGVSIIDKEGLIDDFHDRYLVFDLRNGGHQVLLCTCEIGQIFKPNSSETKGSLFRVNIAEIVKSGKSLIDMIKE